MVKQGDLLFVIDPRPYRMPEQAKADGTRQRARDRPADVATRNALRAPGLTELFRYQEINRAMPPASRSPSRAETGRFNLEWTEVKAPIAGASPTRGRCRQPGSGGQTGATLLTVIVSIDPIHFVFDGSEADFLRYVRLAAAGAGPLPATCRIRSRCGSRTRPNTSIKAG